MCVCVCVCGVCVIFKYYMVLPFIFIIPLLMTIKYVANVEMTNMPNDKKKKERPQKKEIGYV